MERQNINAVDIPSKTIQLPLRRIAASAKVQLTLPVESEEDREIRFDDRTNRLSKVKKRRSFIVETCLVVLLVSTYRYCGRPQGVQNELDQ